MSETDQTRDAILQRAIELQQRERDDLEHAEKDAALGEAVAELGISKQVMERAAADVEFERRRVLARKRARLRYAGIALCLLFALWMVARLAGFPEVRGVVSLADGPYIERFEPQSAAHWTIKTSGIPAAVRFDTTPERGPYAVIAVGAPGEGNASWWVNLTNPRPPDTLRGLKRMKVRVRGDHIDHMRVCARSEKHKRTCSPSLPVTADWVEHEVALDDWEGEERSKGSRPWHRTGRRSPNKVWRLEIKLGAGGRVNTGNGEVAVDDLVFE